jgi:V/A-type H+-transporting ATPase subunit K
MVHLQVQVPNSDAAKVTRCIAKAGLLHLVDIAHGRMLGEMAAPETRELLAAYRAIAHRIRRLAERLDTTFPEPAGELDQTGEIDFVRDRTRLEQQLAPLEQSITGIWQRLTQAKEQSSRTRKARERSELLQRAGVDLTRTTTLRFTAVAFGLAGPDALAALAAALAPAPFAVIPLETDGASSLAAVAVPASIRDRLDSALRVIAFQPIPLPAGGAAMGAVAEKPETAGRALVFVGLAEGIAIYGLIIAIMILGRLT